MRLSDSDLDRMLTYCTQVRGRHGGRDAGVINSFIDRAPRDLPRLVAAYRELRELATKVVDALPETILDDVATRRVVAPIVTLAAYLKGD